MAGLDVGVMSASKGMSSKDYVRLVLDGVRAKNPAEPEFLQAVQEVFG